MVFIFNILYYMNPILIDGNYFLISCPGGGIGRHKGLKIPRLQKRAGSSPAPGTTFYMVKVK
jgi:hypothetical protein